MMRPALLPLSLLLLLAALPAAAQHTVTGTVTSAEDGAPLPGVNVVFQGTTNGTATNASGFYTLEVPDPRGTLVFSFIGFEEQEVAVAGRAVVDVALAPATELLDDVVVIGYGEASRRRLASATSSVDAADIENLPVAGVDAAIQGRTAGVQVTQNSGTPGGGISVRVRGATSVSASNQPLYVVDGVPMLSEDFTQFGYGGQDVTSVTGLSPADIASVEVLKDAAATAIYGSRGANGVVIVTTKRGRSGRPNIAFNAYYGTQNVTRTLDLLGGREYVAYMNQAALNDDPDAALAFGDPDTVAVDTDWQGAAFRQAPVQSYDLAVSGGDARARYYVSGSYFDQTGVLIGSAYDRASVRANLDLNATDRLLISGSFGLSREVHDRIENDNTIRGVLTNAIANQPFIPVYREDGTFTGVDDGLAYVNGIAIGTLNTGRSHSYRALGNVRAEYRLLEGLYLNGRLGTDVLSIREQQYRSPRVNGDYAESVNGVAQSAYNLATRYVAEGYANYRRAFGRHDLDLTGGASVEANELNWNYLRGVNLANEGFEHIMSAGEIEDYDGAFNQNNLVSLFARTSYVFADRYIVSGSLRADGSSRFAPDNKYGVFPSVGLAWRAAEEPFLRPHVGGLLSDLKLRLSYGLTGNQEIGNYAWRSSWGSTTYGDDVGLTPGSQLENRTLTWESTAQANVGVDLALLDGRVSLVADYYHKLTDDLLWGRPVPFLSGASSVTSNVGQIRNEGVELLLRTQNARSPDARGFRWETTLNLSHNRNRVVALYDDEPVFYGRRGSNIVTPGEPLGAFYMYEFVGVDPANGNALYEDVETGGTCVTQATASASPDAGYAVCDDDDRQIVGSPHPDLTGGLTNTLSYGGLDLNVFVYFSYGNELFEASREYSDDGGASLDNKVGDVMGYWRQPGDVTDVPRPSLRGRSGANVISSRFIHDGSFLRLKTVTLGYTLPGRYASTTGMRSVRLYVSGQNLLTFTRFEGLDPEVNYGGSGDNLGLGTEFYTFPQPRTLLVGLQLGL